MAVTDVGIAAGGLDYVIGDAIMQFNKANVCFNLCTTKSAPDGSLYVRFPVYSNVDSSKVTNNATGAEDTDLSATSMTTTAVDVEVLRNGIRIDITDLARWGSGDDLYGNAGDIIGNALAAEFDNHITALFASLSTNTVGDGSAALSLGNWFDSIQKLRASNAPEPYAFVGHPGQIWGSKGLSAVLNVSGSNAIGTLGQPGEQMAQNGYVGTLAGVDVFYSNEIALSGTGTDEAKGAMFSKSTFGVGYKDPMISIEEQRDASAGLSELIGNGYWNSAELVDGFGCLVHTQAA